MNSAPFHFEAFRTLAQARFPELKHINPEITPFYGELYLLTFGEQEAGYRKELADFAKKYNVADALECFGGTAFESSLLAEDTGINCTAIDINPEYFAGMENPGVKYIRGNCFDFETARPEYDLVFVGSANASMESIRSMEKLRHFFGFVKNSLRDKGKFVAAFFGSPTAEEEETYDMWDLGAEEYVIRWHPRWKGCKAKWYSITHYDLRKQFHTYYTLLNVIEPHDADHHWWYHEEGYLSKPWNLHEVENVAADFGFRLLEKDFFNDTRFCPFEKLM